MMARVLVDVVRRRAGVACACCFWWDGCAHGYDGMIDGFMAFLRCMGYELMMLRGFHGTHVLSLEYRVYTEE